VRASIPVPYDLWMRLRVRRRKLQLRFALRMNLEKWFAPAHDVADDSEQPYARRNVGWRAGALGNPSNLPAIDVADSPVKRSRNNLLVWLCLLKTPKAAKSLEFWDGPL